MIDRRHLLRNAAIAGAGLASPVWAQDSIDLRLPGGPGERPITDAFPGKRRMILQRTSPPLLETPLRVFNDGIFTPNDRFYVRWHWPCPTEVDPAAFRLRIDGHVGRPLSLSLAALKRLPHVEIAAVNQCSGNSRGVFAPRVAGGQWAHGAMGNARWTGVRLRDVLAGAGVRAGAVQARFSGLDEPLVDGAPDFAKSLAIDHALADDVIIAWAMNGAMLPLLNGYPLRLVVPGWYSTYWVKALDRIEVLDKADDNYWMAKAYLLPDTPDGGIAPGTRDFPKRPIGAMVPRSFITSVADGAALPWAESLGIGGIAFGGDNGVARVEVSADGGGHWQVARLGADMGRYSFRRFDAAITPPRGLARLMARCTSTAGITQPMAPIWNPGGYQRGNVETTQVRFT
jgi:DMSO/TMAO reductase YedYZ molybdopterin-dependent catalytic subunit